MIITANNPLARAVLVFVDGIDVTKDCVLADDRIGEAIVVVRDKRRRLELAADGRNILTSTLKGKVDIVASPDASDRFRIQFEAMKLEQSNKDDA